MEARLRDFRPETSRARSVVTRVVTSSASMSMRRNSATGQAPWSDAKPRRRRAGTPECERDLRQVRKLGLVVDFFGDAARAHTPPGVVHGVSPVALERDPTLPCRVQLRPVVGSQHDRAAVDREVDGKHVRSVIDDDGDPAKSAPFEQGQALVVIEHFEAGALIDLGGHAPIVVRATGAHQGPSSRLGRYLDPPLRDRVGGGDNRPHEHAGLGTSGSTARDGDAAGVAQPPASSLMMMPKPRP
jgi:hypothetical protein